VLCLEVKGLRRISNFGYLGLSESCGAEEPGVRYDVV
jgi:hypothetical protein